jgi:hypothetical protein
MTAPIGANIVARLGSHVGPLPDTLIDALTRTADPTSLGGILWHPDVTPAQTRAVWDRVSGASLDDRAEVAAAHVVALGANPSLDEFLAELAQERANATGHGYDWDAMLNRVFDGLSAAQITHLTTSENLLAVAVVAAHSFLSDVDRLSLIEHLNAHIPADEQGPVAQLTGRAIVKLRQQDVDRGQVAVLSSTCLHVLESIGLAAKAFTSVEATHIARLTLPPRLASETEAWHDGDWVRRCIEAQGIQIDPDLLAELAADPQATPALREAIALALHQQATGEGSTQERHLTHMPITALLAAVPELTTDQWAAALVLLEALPKSMSVLDAAAVLAAVTA